jgi:hypothetical protein
MNVENAMDTCMLVAIEDLHVKLTDVKASIVHLNDAARFEKGCIHSLKTMLGHSTLLYANPPGRIRRIKKVDVDTAESKDMCTSLCIELYARLQAEIQYHTLVNGALKELISERELLESEYYKYVDN